MKQGDPPADVAADRLEAIVANARAARSKVLIIIHGYGSGGEGGSIRASVRERLARMKEERKVRSIIFGEVFGAGNADALSLATEHRTLLAPHLFGAGNQGITVVTL